LSGFPNACHFPFSPQGNTYGAASNPPDLLRDEDLESRHRDQQRKRTNFELSDAGVVEITPTDVSQSDMNTGRMGVPAKERYGGGVGIPQERDDRMLGQQQAGYGHGYGDSSELHWTEKAAETIEETKAKVFTVDNEKNFLQILTRCC
jgi:hypothetical protein